MEPMKPMKPMKNISTLSTINTVMDTVINTGPANETIQSDLNINMSYKEIADKLGLTIQEVKDAEASALKKMRHPKIGKVLKDYLKI